MSSVPKTKPFGEIGKRRHPYRTPKRSVFKVVVDGNEVAEFIQLLEIFYNSHVQVRQSGVSKIYFTSDPGRTIVGIRVAARLCQVELISARKKWP